MIRAVLHGKFKQFSILNCILYTLSPAGYKEMVSLRVTFSLHFNIWSDHIVTLNLGDKRINPKMTAMYKEATPVSVAIVDYTLSLLHIKHVPRCNILLLPLGFLVFNRVRHCCAIHALQKVVFGDLHAPDD